MNNAFEYEVKYDSKGRLVERRCKIGAILVTTVAGFTLALTGHTIWNAVVELIRMVKS